ncbi:MAG: PQQ-binding-like beta-propeller repeat protein [Mycobacteriaceae bacterium]|nr:PQQ-binding-like beta-propeller repeat protein [Mycobacteriaceae bacterium]MBV9641221.1 PQQ-binding-like beta-propeller repeat protein [Mycobacteriaceae bacterium]
MTKPERRTRADLLAAAALVVIVAVAAVLIWWTSDARATISRPATAPAPALTPPRAVPASLQQLWTAASARTDEPFVVEGSVVTGDGHEVVGRDPVTGAQRWSFARDRDLCGLTWIYNLAVAVYPDDRGCGQVSTVDAATGQRGPTRSGYADKQVALSSDGTTVLSAGRSYLEMWRSDMVRTLAWGAIDAPVNPPVAPNPPCQLLSAAASSAAVSILQTCPNNPGVRLTMLKVAKEDVSPDQRYAEPVGVRADSGAKVLAVSELHTAVYLPTPQPRIVVYNDTGQQFSSTLLPKPAAPSGTASHAGSFVTYWTGDSVVVLDAATLLYRYTVNAGTSVPLGPAAMMANRLLIPVTGGIAVYDPPTGALERVIPVARGAATGPIVPAVAGTTVLEQRGATLVGLGQRA